MKLPIQTVSPIYSGVHLRTGIDPTSAAYTDLVDRLPAESPSIRVPNRVRPAAGSDYDDLRASDYDLRLLVWEPPSDDTDTRVRFHLYPYGITVMQADFVVESELDSAAVQDTATRHAKDLFATHATALARLLNEVTRALGDEALPAGQEGPDSKSGQIAWTARAVLLGEDARDTEAGQAFIRQWLQETVDHEDADAIIRGRRTHSVSWVNYLFLGQETHAIEGVMDVVRNAQAYYAAQTALNRDMLHVIRRANDHEQLRRAELALRNSRQRMQFLHIQFRNDKALMRRSSRREMDRLLEAWEFDALVSNGQAWQDLCSDEIERRVSRRATRSTIATDLILVGIGLLAIFELLIALIAYSRELMANPALSFRDSGVSAILRVFAEVDTDAVLLVGFLMFLSLAALYGYWKRNA